MADASPARAAASPTGARSTPRRFRLTHAAGGAPMHDGDASAPALDGRDDDGGSGAALDGGDDATVAAAPSAAPRRGAPAPPKRKRSAAAPSAGAPRRAQSAPAQRGGAPSGGASSGEEDDASAAAMDDACGGLASARASARRAVIADMRDTCSLFCMALDHAQQSWAVDYTAAMAAAAAAQARADAAAPRPRGGGGAARGARGAAAGASPSVSPQRGGRGGASMALPPAPWRVVEKDALRRSLAAFGLDRPDKAADAIAAVSVASGLRHSLADIEARAPSRLCGAACAACTPARSIARAHHNTRAHACQFSRQTLN
jgi:hypothetical protein